jgi:hypothetical protein
MTEARPNNKVYIHGHMDTLPKEEQDKYRNFLSQWKYQPSQRTLGWYYQHVKPLAKEDKSVLLSRLKLENDTLRKQLASNKPKVEEGHRCLVLGDCKGACRS